MTHARSRTQGGFVLIEALVAIAIFSFAVIGLIGLQSSSVASSTDAKYRSDASYLASQIIGQIWADRPNIANYNHMNSGAPCQASGAATTNPTVLAWLADVTATLPGATSGTQAVSIGTNNTVTVVVCWKRAQETTYHSQTTVAQVN